MNDNSVCGTCGYSWITGQDGSHSCPDELLKRITELQAALLDLLNDCINFDGGELSDCKMKQAVDVLANKV